MKEKYKLIRQCSEEVKNVNMHYAKSHLLTIEETIEATYISAFALSMALVEDVEEAHEHAILTLNRCVMAMKEYKKEENQ